LSAAFAKPQLGQFVSDPLFGEEAVAGAGGEVGETTEAEAGATSGEPPMGVPHVSHHSVSLLW
jgi:hypothetical protein